MLIGNLTRDPELRYLPNGTAVCTFGLATNRSWKDANGQVQEDAEFHNIVAWAKMGEICHQLLAKGMMIYIEGSLSTRSWEDESGTTKYKTEIRADEMKLLDPKGKSGMGAAERPTEGATETAAPKSGKTAEELLDELSGDSTEEKSSKKSKKSSDKKEEKEEKDEDPLNDVPF